MVKKRNRLIGLFPALILLLCAALPHLGLGGAFFHRTAAAESAPAPAVRAELIKPQTETKYFYLDGPLTLAADESNLYAGTDKRSVYAFTTDGADTDKITLTGNAEKLVSCGTSLFSVQSGVLKDSRGAELISGVIDVTAAGGLLYAAVSDAITVLPVAQGAADISKLNTIPLPFTPQAVTAAENCLYAAAKSKENRFRSDIYRIEPSEGTVAQVFQRAGIITDMTSGLSSDLLITLEGASVNRYEYKNGLLKNVSRRPAADLIAISGNSSRVFGLSGGGKVVSWDYELKEEKEILASASGGSGFFDSPLFAATRKNSLFVCDYGNNRVVKVEGEQFTPIAFDFVQPRAVAVDNLGNVYVAHNMDVIEQFDDDLNHLRSTTVAGTLITDLLFDSRNNLYISDQKSVYLMKAGSSQPQPYTQATAHALTAAPDGYTPYLLDKDERSVYALSEGKKSRVFAYSCDAVDFAVDIEKNFYLLSRGGSIFKYSAADGYAENILSETDYESGYALSGGCTRITLSTVKNGSLNYGDIVVTDTKRHCLRRIDGAAFGVKVIDDSFTPPDVDGDNSPNVPAAPDDPNHRIIRTALSDIDVYEKPMEMSPFYKITEGRKVIVADYDIDESDAFAFVLIDDLTTGRSRLISGYVYKVLLSEPLPYEKPVASHATAYNDHTPVRKWPSRNAQTLSGYNEVKKGVSFTLLDFVKDYKDEYPAPVKWYRVDVDGLGEGYVAAADMSVRNYQPIFIRPQTNAVVLSVNGSTGAPLYFKTQDGLTISDEEQPLVTGTRVEVVGAFDQSEKYTLIKYFDENLGTLTGYVETVYLKYDGVSVLLVVTIIIIALTSIGLILALVWRYVAKRRQLTKA